MQGEIKHWQRKPLAEKYSIFMIKFFGHLRMRLIPETKFSKYLLYAIGEIVLVVIGILIALQINNWNEKRKAEIEEVKILTVLLEDLKTAEITCLNQLEQEKINIDLYEKFLGNEDSKATILNHKNIDSLFFRLLWGVGENTSVVSAISEIQTSGNSGKISNDKIRKQIATLDIQLNEVATFVKDRLTVQQLSIDNFVLKINNFSKLVYGSDKNYDIDYGPINDYQSLINDQKIQNAIAMKLDLTGSVIRERVKLISEINKLNELMEKELKILVDD